MRIPQRGKILRLAAACRCDWLNGTLAFCLVTLEDWIWKIDWRLAGRRTGVGVVAGIRRVLKGLRAIVLWEQLQIGVSKNDGENEKEEGSLINKKKIKNKKTKVKIKPACSREIRE